MSVDQTGIATVTDSGYLTAASRASAAMLNLRDPMPLSTDRPALPIDRAGLLARLDALGIHHATLDHEAVFTVAQSAELHQRLPGGHTKNLFLKDAKDKLYLLVAESRTPIDLKLLPKLIGSAKLSFGRPDLLQEVLGVSPGAVTALAIINDTLGRVRVVVDQQLMQYAEINCHPLVNTATTRISRDSLVRFFRACDHEPLIVSLAGDTGATS